MGCGCSKRVEVATNNSPAEKASHGQAKKSSSGVNQENGEIDYKQLFKIIKAAAYINHIRQITSLRNDIEEMKEDIQNAALKSDGDMPAIPEDESNVDNPRRVRPARNHAREKAASIALEVSTAYRILRNAGQYKKDTVGIEKLKKQYGQLQDNRNRKNWRLPTEHSSTSSLVKKPQNYMLCCSRFCT